MAKIQYLTCCGLASVGLTTIAIADEYAQGYAWPPTYRVYGIVTEPSFGYSAYSDEADYEGDKAGLADVNPAGIDFRAQGYLGYHSNPTHEIEDYEEEAWYFGLRISAAQRIVNGPLQVYWGASARHTWYDTEVADRPKGDASATDFSLRLGLEYQFNPSVKASTINSFDSLAHLDFNHGALRYGLQRDDVLRYESRNALQFRYDGQELGGTGVESALRFDYLGYRGDEWDMVDFDRYRTIFETGYRVSEGFAVGGYVGYGWKTWNEIDELDSESWLYGLYAGGKLSSGIDWSIRGGLEHRSYEEDFLSERDEPFVDFKISGEITDSLFVSFNSFYGIGDYYQNGGSEEHLDPLVFRNSLSLVQGFGPYVGRLTASYQKIIPELEGESFSNDGLRQEFYTLALGLDRTFAERWNVGLEVGAGKGDYGFGGEDEYEIFFSNLHMGVKF